MTAAVVCVGRLREKGYAAAAEEYLKRLSRYGKTEIVELPEHRLGDDPSPAEIERALAYEAAQIEEKLPRSATWIAMCVEGRVLSSPQLSETITRLGASGASQLVFLIGGSFGLHPRIKEKAALCLSMSAMTFPHHLARVMLLEQIYRAYQIAGGTKYHK